MRVMFPVAFRGSVGRAGRSPASGGSRAPKGAAGRSRTSVEDGGESSRNVPVAHAPVIARRCTTAGAVPPGASGARLASQGEGSVRADPERPGLDALDSEDAVRPRGIGEHGAVVVIAGCAGDEHGVLAVDVAYWTAERKSRYPGGSDSRSTNALPEPISDRSKATPDRCCRSRPPA
jgi:hypothetical protein